MLFVISWTFCSEAGSGSFSWVETLEIFGMVRAPPYARTPLEVVVVVVEAEGAVVLGAEGVEA